MKGVSSLSDPNGAMAFAQHWGDGREDALADDSSAMLAACTAGDLAVVTRLLADGEAVLYANRFFGETPCEQALENGHVAVAELLLAAVLSHPTWREQATELFWRRLVSAAMRSRQLPVLDFVLSYEPDLNSTVRHSEKPLFDAVRADNVEMVKVLIAYGADVSGRDPADSTVLHISVKYGASRVLTALKASSIREDVNARDAQGNTALHYAADCAQLDVVRTLLAMGADANLCNRLIVPPLHMAVNKARLDMVKLLLDEGQANVNAADFQDNTALLLLAAMNTSDIDEDLSESDGEEEPIQVQIATLLLENGADVNAANTATATPLHHAMRRLNFDLMDLLLAHGADVNQCNRFGDTPLHQAARLALIPLVWQKLLAFGADPLAQDRSGQTPMELIPNSVLRAAVAEVVESSAKKMSGGFGSLMDFRGKSLADLHDTVRGFGFQGRCLTLLLAMLLFGFVLAIPRTSPLVLSDVDGSADCGLLCGAVLCCLRVDGSISTSWAVLLAPLWVLDAVYYGGLGFSLLLSDKVYAYCKTLLLLTLQIFLVLKLDGIVNWSLVKVLAPYFAYEVLNLLEALVGAVLGHQMLTNDSVGAGVSQTDGIETERRLLVLAVARKMFLTLLRLAQGVLIGLKVDGSLDSTTWWVVLIPVWLHVAYFFSYPVKKYVNSTAKYPLLDAICTTLVIVVFVMPLFVLALRLEDATFSSFYVVLPWLVLVRPPVGIFICIL
ncbi:hypothetical protein BBJ28_00021486 [Nothophytophthora sp. Chile5]|nr:hypothetical protein BBJ28_00021486 [Nothophytophthora sp. Chile5]